MAAERVRSTSDFYFHRPLSPKKACEKAVEEKLGCMGQISGIRIVEDTRWRDKFFETAKGFLGRPKEGLHVSDLIFLRRTYFRTKYPEIGLTDEEVVRFIAGRGHHHAVEVLAALPEYREVEVTWNGIRGHIDIYENEPVELKTTRAMKVASAEEIWKEFPFWIRQLAYYCAMVNKPRGKLMVFYLNIPANSGNRSGLTPKLTAFEVEFGDLRGVRQEMLERKEALEKALATGDPLGLEPCPRWMCEKCRFVKACGISSLPNCKTD